MTPPPPLCFCASQPSGTGKRLERSRLPPGQVGYDRSNSNNISPLNSILPEIGVTKQTFKKLEAIQMVREQREQHKQDLAYHARPFVLCGLPLRQPPADQLIYTRRKGRFSLEVAAHPRFGLPYGQDRLIPIWVTTLAVKHESRAIHFESAAQILEFFRLPKDGPHYRRMVQGFQRVFAATIFFGTDQRPEKAAVIDMARFHSFDRMHLWLNNRKEAHVPAHESFENEIVLSEAFYREIDEHRIPVEREAIAALARAPGVLDFYMWLVWKSWSVKGRPASVPLVSPNGLSEQMGSAENAQPRLFRYNRCSPLSF